MTCNRCVAKIESTVGQLLGVVSGNGQDYKLCLWGRGCSTITNFACGGGWVAPLQTLLDGGRVATLQTLLVGEGSNDTNSACCKH